MLYSKLGEKADAVIKRIVSEKTPSHLITVSSDREVASYAWSHGSTPIQSEDFMEALMAGPNGGGSVYEEEEEGQHTSFKKSNKRKGLAHRPSKRETATRRALGKL